MIFTFGEREFAETVALYFLTWERGKVARVLRSYNFIFIYFLFFKYCADVENCGASKDFGFIYIYRWNISLSFLSGCCFFSAKKVDAASKYRLRAKFSARHKTENFAKFDSNYCQQHRDFKDSNYVIVIFKWMLLLNTN